MEKAVFLASKLKFCIVIDENSMLSQNANSKVSDQNMIGLNFKVFLDLERVSTISSKSKLNFKRDLYGIKLPHKELDCIDCDNTKKCAQCEKKPNMNCFNFEVAKSRKKCMRKTPQFKYYSTEITKLKRLPERSLVICFLIMKKILLE